MERAHPTEQLTPLEPQSPLIGLSELRKPKSPTDFEAL